MPRGPVVEVCWGFAPAAGVRAVTGAWGEGGGLQGRFQEAMVDSSAVYFENSAPILRVEDMKAALEFYVGVLGFTSAAWGTEEFTCVQRDGACIYLCRGGQGRGGAWVWVGVDDAKRLCEQL